MPTAHEQLSEQFRKWELRGRGWQVFDEPVYPEPPFVPFDGHYLPEPPVVDDGRRPTFLSSLFRKVTAAPEPPPVLPEPEEEPEPTPLSRGDLAEFQASLPDKLDVSREVFEQFLLNLSLCREPIAFELLGTHKKVTAQFATASTDAPLLRSQLQAFFSEAVFVPHKGALEQAWETTTGDEVLAVEFGLARAHRTGQRELANDHKIVELVGFNLFTGRQHSERDGQIETGAFLLHVGRREIDGRAAHRKFEPGVGQRGCDAVA
jgi:hypothetical protein